MRYYLFLFKNYNFVEQNFHSFYCVGGGASTSGECSVGYYCPTNIPNPLEQDIGLKTIGSSGPKQVVLSTRPKNILFYWVAIQIRKCMLKLIFKKNTMKIHIIKNIQQAMFI